MSACMISGIGSEAGGGVSCGSTRNSERRGMEALQWWSLGRGVLGFEHSTSCWDHIKHNKMRIHTTYSSFVE
jgi:hypothetical protein